MAIVLLASKVAVLFSKGSRSIHAVGPWGTKHTLSFVLSCLEAGLFVFITAEQLAPASFSFELEAGHWKNTQALTEVKICRIFYSLKLHLLKVRQQPFWSRCWSLTQKSHLKMLSGMHFGLQWKVVQFRRQASRTHIAVIRDLSKLAVDSCLRYWTLEIGFKQCSLKTRYLAGILQAELLGRSKAGCKLGS